MAVEWVKTNHKGLRYYEHANRKHGKKRDRYYAIRLKVDGKDHSYGVGWLSDGVPMEVERENPGIGFEEYCLMLLRQYKGNLKTGSGARSPKEQRRITEEKEAQERAQAEQEARDNLTFAEVWKDSYQGEASRKKSWAREESFFRLWIEPAIGKLPLRTVSQIHLEGLKKKMREGNKRSTKKQPGQSPRTIEYCLAVIRQVFNCAIEHGLFQGKNPVKRKRGERLPDNKRVRFLTYEEADLLLPALRQRSVELYNQAVLSLHTGMRAGEIFGLCYGDIDLEKGTILLRDTKSKRNRYVYMTEAVKEIFRAMTFGARNDLVFPTRKGRRRTEISNVFLRTVESLGLNTGVRDPRMKVLFHTLRHTYASWLVQEGVPLYVVQKALGHQSLAMTERYSHLSENSLQTATAALEGGIKAAKQTKEGQILPFMK